MEAPSQVIHDGESISSRTYEGLRGMQVGDTFTVRQLSARIGIFDDRWKAVGAFISVNTHRGMFEIIGTSGSHAILYRMVDPTQSLPFRVNSGVGGKAGRKVPLNPLANWREAKERAALRALSEARHNAAPAAPETLVAAPEPPSLENLPDRLVELAIEVARTRTSLARYTNEELLAELARRSNEKRM